MQDLINDIVDCQKCNGLNCLKNKTLSAPGYGNIKSKVIFYGSSVGGSGEKRVIPFASGSGRLLDKILDLAGIKKEQIFLSNVVKCRLPNLRSPKDFELNNCKAYVFEEIDIIKPQIVVSMGAIATKVFLGKNKLENMVYKDFDFPNFRLIPMYHPAYIMRGLGDKDKYFQKMIELFQYAVN